MMQVAKWVTRKKKVGNESLHVYECEQKRKLLK